MKRLLAVYAFLVFMMLAWAFGAQAQLGSNTRTVKADVIDSNTASLIEFLKDIEINSTGYVLLPKGTTAQRPGSPVAGMFRYNTEENTFEGYTDEWGPIAGGGGGATPFEPNEDYEKDQTVIEDDKLWYANSTFTAGAAFDSDDWTLISPLRLVDGVTKVERGSTLYEVGSRNPEYAELLADPSFEVGVSEWSCTDATVTQAAGGVSGDFQAQIDFTADDGFCELESTVSGDTADQEYLPRAYVKTSDATVKLEFLDGTRLVAEPEVLADGSFQSYAAQVIPSTSIITRVTGDNTDQAFVDAAGHTLGGFNRAASKNCSGVLDCENTFTAKIENNGTTCSVKTDTDNLDWIASCARDSLGTTTLTLDSSLSSDSLNCGASVGVSGSHNRLAEPIQTASTSTISVETRATTGTLYDVDYQVFCFKSKPDYKTTEDKGVVTIPDNKDARLAVTNEGTTSNVTIGDATITVPFDTVKPISNLIDFAGNEATFQKSGKYELSAFLVYVEAGSSQLKVFPEIDTGSGFSSLTGDDSKCATLTGSSATVQTVSCDFIFEASKGDKLRLRATSNTAGTVIANATGKYPRMLITPLGGRQNIGEFNRPKTAYIKDVKPSGTAGGTFTAGAWETRDLNTLEGDTGFVSLSGNQVTLAPGKYKIRASAPAYKVDRHKIRLRNITDSVDSEVGSSEQAAASDSNQSRSFLESSITITTSKTFEIQHQGLTSKTTDGFGLASTFGVDEVYTQVKIKKVD